jgi:multidrug efflux pump subunit AcrB
MTAGSPQKIVPQPEQQPVDDAKYFFIRRPVMASVISIVVVLLGSFAIKLLPIARYPQITPPAVTISAVFPGASAEDASQAVAAPIEEQLASLQGMLYFASTSASDGSTTISVTFDVTRSSPSHSSPRPCATTASRSSKRTPIFLA